MDSRIRRTETTFVLQLRQPAQPQLRGTTIDKLPVP